MHVKLSSKERQKLDRALRGSVFGSNPTRTMQRMGLTPLHKPFGTDLTIVDFARAARLKSVPHLEACRVKGSHEGEWIRVDEAIHSHARILGHPSAPCLY